MYNETQVAEDLYTALKLFYKKYAEMKNSNFFIFGESYAGKVNFFLFF